jgi:hypothetical protein
MKLVGFSEILSWAEGVMKTTDEAKITMVEAGVVADFEKYIGAKLAAVTSEIAYLDGGKPYLFLPHLNVSSVKVYEDSYRAFGSDTEMETTKYQVFGERGVLRIGGPKHRDQGGIAYLDKYFTDAYMDDYFLDRAFAGRREFLRGLKVIKVQYNGGYSGPNVVLGTDSKNYTCYVSHTSADANKPITGASYASYWYQMGANGAVWGTGTAYTIGSLPDDLKLALLEQINFKWRRRNDPGLMSVTYPDGSVNKLTTKKFLSSVQDTLDNYRRTAI